MATRRSFSNYKASGDNRWSRTAFKADLIVALGQSQPGSTSGKPTNVCYASDHYRSGKPLNPTRRATNGRRLTHSST
jgi:hypothetical protein